MQSQIRHNVRVAVYLFLIDRNKLFLIKRYNTGWKDGDYTLPSGHLEKNETIQSAMIREAKEEVGITIRKKDLTVAHVMHRVSDLEYIDFFLIANKWIGTPYNAEPTKCSEASWYSLSDLPENTLKHVQVALQNIRKKTIFSELIF